LFNKYFILFIGCIKWLYYSSRWWSLCTYFSLVDCILIVILNYYIQRLHFLFIYSKISLQFWKRRFFELRGKTLYLYRDETDKNYISKLELDGQVTGVTDAQSEVLILNSFKVDFRSSEPYYFFSDDKKDKELIVAAIGRYASAK
jgi:hypothetical protein